MKSFVWLLLLFVSCNSLPIEPQTNEVRLTNFNPFKMFGGGKFERDSHSSTDKDPFAKLLSDSLHYLTRATNVTLGFVDRTSDKFRAQLKEAKTRIEQEEFIEPEPSILVISKENQTDSVLDPPTTTLTTIQLEEVVTESQHPKKITGTEPSEQIDLNLDETPKEENDFFSRFIKPWTFMDQPNEAQEHDAVEESLFVGKHNPYTHGFWNDEQDELVILPQKVSVYPQEEVSDDIKTKNEKAVKIVETSTEKAKNVESNDEKETESDKAEDLPTTDPLKMKPIELENFGGQNLTIKRNESICFLNILASYPPINSTRQFYNLAASRLKKAAPNLTEVRVDGGYVQTITNESDSYINELKFLRNNLEQIQNSLCANDIKLKSFDFVVWFFEEQDEIDQKERAETLANQLEARVYPHIFTKDLMQCHVELPSDYSNINLTVYIARKSESALVLAPSNERTPYYKTLLSALDPFLQFLKALQKSMGAVSRSMQKWVQNGQPLMIEKNKAAEIELKTHAKNFDHDGKAHDPILQFFDQPLRRQSNFLSNIENILKIETIPKED